MSWSSGRILRSVKWWGGFELCQHPWTTRYISQVPEILLDHQAVSNWTLSFHTSHGGACPISRQPQTFKVTWGGRFRNESCYTSRVRLCRRRTRVNPKLWKAGCSHENALHFLRNWGDLAMVCSLKGLKYFCLSAIVHNPNRGGQQPFFLSQFFGINDACEKSWTTSRNSHEKNSLHPSS